MYDDASTGSLDALFPFCQFCTSLLFVEAIMNRLITMDFDVLVLDIEPACLTVFASKIHVDLFESVVGSVQFFLASM